MVTEKSAKSFKVGSVYLELHHVLKHQKTWIIINYNQKNGFSQLRRDFILRLKPVNKKTAPNVKAFSRVVNKFMKKPSKHFVTFCHLFVNQNVTKRVSGLPKK